MYFLQFSKIMKCPKMLLTRIQKSVQNVYTVTHGSCDILKYHCKIYMLCSVLTIYIEFTVLQDSVAHVESNA